MPKYLFQVTYTAEGAKGLLNDGGTKRRAVAKQLVESLGGALESFYYGFGETDIFAVADLPDDEAAAALSLTVGASGAISGKTTVLLTPEQIDQAAKKSATYTPPGR